MKEIAEWQRAAGLLARKPIRLLTAPGAELQAALKPNARKGNGYGVLRQGISGDVIYVRWSVIGIEF
jgi:hypothetical protein